MARRRSLITLLSGISVGCLLSAAGAQPPPDRPQGDRPRPPAPPEPQKRFFHHNGPEADAMRDRAMRDLQKLSPEQRADLWKTVWAVINLPPEKRQSLLGMDDERRKFAREEIERAMSDSGLRLDEEKRIQFVRRYFEERRTIEEKIRKESDEKRRQLLGEMRARLKQEFETAGARTAPPEGAK